MIIRTEEVLRKRVLEKSYLVLYCMETNIYLESRYTSEERKRLFIFFGCTLEGKKKYVSCILEPEKNKTSCWYDFFQEIKSRGNEKIIFGLLPRLRELREAIKIAYSDIEIFDSCDGMIKKLRKYNSYKTKDEIYREIKKLYLAEDEVEYEINYKDFISKYSKHAFIMDIAGEEVKELRKNYKYPRSVRRIIYAFYYIIEMEKRFDELCNNRMYSNKETFIEDCMTFINRSEAQVHYKRDEWAEVISELYDQKRDMIKPYL